jgi:hypothetical protein
VNKGPRAWAITTAARVTPAAVAFLAWCASAAHAQIVPDATTVTVTGYAELCRPGGSCFLPEPDDPIFVGDEITTHLPGRIDLGVRGAGGAPIAVVSLTPNGRIRFDRGSRVPVEIDLGQGLLIIEVIGPPGIDVTFGDLGCRIQGGTVAVGHNEVDGRHGYVANRSAACVCFTEARTAHPVAPDTIATFRRGQPFDVRPLADSYWDNLRQQR